MRMFRALRLGYNVLMADNDVIFFKDPYVFLKQPPFKVCMTGHL